MEPGQNPDTLKVVHDDVDIQVPDPSWSMSVEDFQPSSQTYRSGAGLGSCNGSIGREHGDSIQETHFRILTVFSAGWNIIDREFRT